MLLGGRYRLISLAGQGGMAEVWRAEAQGAAGFRRQVAVKRVHTHMLNTEELRAMFVEEARVTSLLDHPNVVQVFDFGEDARGFFLVMEWVEGMTLKDFAEERAVAGSRASPALVSAIAIEVLHALEAAHTHETRRADGTTVAAPIVHRDVSPSNVLLSVRGVVKLADFGFARAFDRSRVTPAGVIKGKLCYLSPEQVRGEPASERSDLYSCGIMLWELLVARRLYEGVSDRGIVRSLMERRAHQRVRDVRPDVPESIAQVVDRALSIDPADRHASASEFARALCDALRLIPERTDATRIAREVAESLAQRRARGADEAAPRAAEPSNDPIPLVPIARKL